MANGGSGIPILAQRVLDQVLSAPYSDGGFVLPEGQCKLEIRKDSAGHLFWALLKAGQEEMVWSNDHSVDSMEDRLKQIKKLCEK